MSLANIEFFSYEEEVWYRLSNGNMGQLKESDYNIINPLLEHLSSFYPKAYQALLEEYNGSALNRSYFRYRMASRFIKCNFAQLDNIPDISDSGKYTFECVPCPLRGECKHERVICRPEFDHKLSSAELRVLRLWADNFSEDDIAERLHLSPHTVHNHIYNAYHRLDIHSKSEFTKYVKDHNLFQ